MKTDELFQLFQNRKLPQSAKAGRDFCNLSEADKDGKKTATLYLYDEISYWTYNDADTFRRRLDALDVDEIHVRINSPGGSVFDGVAIYNLLVAHKATIIVHIDGLAASIASVIALSGDEIHIAENAMTMIHNPSAFVWGDSEECRKMAGLLDAVKGAIVNTYETRTNLERAELTAAMDAETWYSADDAVAKGFATKKVTAQAVTACWSGDDFPGLPENARKLGKHEKKPDAENRAEDAPPPPPPKQDPEPELVGSVDDVNTARDRVRNLGAKYGIEL